MRKFDIPPLSVDLIEALDQEYPHRCPSIQQTEREIWMNVGARQLVDSLKAKIDRNAKEHPYAHVRNTQSTQAR